MRPRFHLPRRRPMQPLALRTLEGDHRSLSLCSALSWPPGATTSRILDLLSTQRVLGEVVASKEFLALFEPFAHWIGSCSSLWWRLLLEVMSQDGRNLQGQASSSSSPVCS